MHDDPYLKGWLKCYDLVVELRAEVSQLKAEIKRLEARERVGSADHIKPPPTGNLR